MKLSIEKQLKLYRHLKKYWWPYGLLWGVVYVLLGCLFRDDWAFDSDWWTGNVLLALVTSVVYGGLGFCATSLHWIDQLEKKYKSDK